MTHGKRISPSHLILFITLVLGARISGAGPEEISLNSGLPTPQYSSVGEPLTNIEAMELHQRRFIDAANNVAKLFSRFDRKVHEVTLAAKAASSFPYNERIQYQLLNKTRQIEREQKSLNSKYLQLQSQMEYEFRSFIAASNNFMEQQDKIKN
jgi:hypothetical protein